MRPTRAVISLLHFYALIVYALSMVKHQTTKYLLYKLYLCYTFCSNNLLFLTVEMTINVTRYFS